MKEIDENSSNNGDEANKSHQKTVVEMMNYSDLKKNKKEKNKTNVKEKVVEKEDPNTMGKILTLAISPLNTKIALYNNLGQIILFDSGLNYLDKTFF